MLNEKELDDLSKEELEKERIRTIDRIEELRYMAILCDRQGMRETAKRRRDALAAGKRYLARIEKALEAK